MQKSPKTGSRKTASPSAHNLTAFRHYSILISDTLQIVRSPRNLNNVLIPKRTSFQHSLMQRIFLGGMERPIRLKTFPFTSIRHGRCFHSAVRTISSQRNQPFWKSMMKVNARPGKLHNRILSELYYVHRRWRTAGDPPSSRRDTVPLQIFHRNKRFPLRFSGI